VTYRQAWKTLSIAVPLAVGISVVAILFLPKVPNLARDTELPPNPAIISTPGMRALSVKVNEVIGVAGFVVPGTRVDVLVTIREKDESRTRVAVSNVQILTAGTRYDQENAGRPIPATVVTLLVTPEDSERIALAQTEGQLMLSLRNPELPGTPRLPSHPFFGDPPAPPKPAVKRPAPIEPIVPAVERPEKKWQGDAILGPGSLADATYRR
jgi:pilus assembly protein CpaB